MSLSSDLAAVNYCARIVLVVEESAKKDDWTTVPIEEHVWLSIFFVISLVLGSPT